MPEYTVVSDVVACVAATEKSVLEIEAGAGRRLKVKEIRLTFDGASGSAVPARVRLCRPGADSTSAASTPTPNPKDPADDAAEFTARAGGTPDAAADTIMHEFYVHPQGGHHEKYPPGTEIVVPVAGRFAIQVLAPAGVNAIGELTVEE